MKVFNCLYALLGSAAWLTHEVYGQASATTMITEPVTGFTFASFVDDSPGGITWGYALPPDADKVASTEYIGYLIGKIDTKGGWAGLSHSSSMTNSLLLMAWPNGNGVLTSFRYATGYVAPDLYSGNATITQIYHNVNKTHYELVYRCEGCWSWDGGKNPTTGFQALSYAQGLVFPNTPSDPNSDMLQHEFQGNFGADPASALASDYSQWATKTFGGSATSAPFPNATTTTTTTSMPGTATTTTTSLPPVVGTPVPNTTYDYIVCGAGAAGIPLADKLSEVGKSVLLIERGLPSSGRYYGTMRPQWLNGTNLTRFGVPGLDNEIWADSKGIACTDVEQMAGCVLGGGTAINAGLWWKPTSLDWDVNFPNGWKSEDMAEPVSRVFSRIPGTDLPSMDGNLYLPNGYNLIGGALDKAGWENITANDSPEKKNQTFMRGPFMYSGGERGGPMATYLVSASARDNFKLIMNTDVRRVVRNGSRITGVEVSAYGNGGYSGTISVTPKTGRVMLSAGTFGSAKLLLRSGIGPSDQLDVVAKSAMDSPTMIDKAQWINLPVGQNLDDHVNTDVVISHPNVTFYDFYGAYDAPIAADRDAYLKSRSVILAQSAPNIGTLFFESIYGSDGKTRQLQWTARCEGPSGTSNTTMTISQYLGRGATSRGAANITPQLRMKVSTVPYLRTDEDKAAVVKGIENLQAILKDVQDLTFLSPKPNQTAADFVDKMPVTPSARRANHWIGTAKMGTDDGRANGTAVVDTDTKVYGTDNLFVVDASIFPGMVLNNPSALIVAVAERAAERILAPGTSSAGNETLALCAGK